MPPVHIIDLTPCRGTRVQALAAGPASSEGGTPGRDAYAGFNALYAANRKPGPITEAGCTMWPIALGRRNYLFVGAADVGSGPTGAASGHLPERFRIAAMARSGNCLASNGRDR
jgi:hypothetical protein